MHWLGIYCWRMHREVRGKGFFKGENNKIENSASWGFSWNTFHSIKKKKKSFLSELTPSWAISNPPIFTHNSTVSGKVHMSHQGITSGTLFTLFTPWWHADGADLLQLFLFPDMTEISHVSGNALQYMSRTMAISTTAFAILDIHTKALLHHQLACLATAFSTTS